MIFVIVIMLPIFPVSDAPLKLMYPKITATIIASIFCGEKKPQWGITILNSRKTIQSKHQNPEHKDCTLQNVQTSSSNRK